MNYNYQRMLKEVMAADFTVIDLNLYLDTHPYDQNALALYNTSVKRAIILRQNFEKMYGPLTAFCTQNYGNRWQWIQDKWPWEI